MKKYRFPLGIVKLSSNLLLVAALIAGFFLIAQPVLNARAATTITVTTFTDVVANDGYCSLREAIIAANSDKVVFSGPGECPAGSGADTIVLPAGTYTITAGFLKTSPGTTGELTITSDISITGAGADTTTIQAVNFSNRIFRIQSGSLNVSGVTVQGSNSNNDGAGFYNTASLTLNGVVVTSNFNSGKGGGIYNSSTLVINNSTIWGNSAGGNGGGIFTTSGSVTVNNSTISGNVSNTSGGGIYQGNGTLSLNNVTIAGNTADANLNGNGGGGGVSNGNGTFNLVNTLIAGNQDKSATVVEPDCAGTLNSQGYNLIQNLAGCTLTGSTTGNLTGVNPLLGPLQNNGGHTPTQAIAFNSPAVNAGNPAAPGSSGTACLAADQRGITRPQSTNCDIGAFELQVVRLTIGPATGGTITASPAGPYFFGQNVTLTAAASTGYSFAGWTGDCSGTALTCTLLMNGNKTVGATFNLIPVTLTLNQATGGTITASPGGPYFYGNNVTLTAAPATGYSFVSWSGDCSGTTTTCALQLNGNKTVSATYARIPVTLTLNQSTGGTISAAPLDPYLYGDPVVITATPDYGYQLGSWTGDCSGAVSPCNLSLNGNKVVGVTFTFALQTGPVFTVNNTNDDAGSCYILSCDLRQAILAANSHPNGTALDQVVFNLPGGGAQILSIKSALPAVSDPLVIDATTVAGQTITLDGALAGASDGLAISAGNSSLRGVTLTHFSGNGVVLASSGNTLSGNTLASNGKSGILVQAGSNNTLTNNTIGSNGGAGVLVQSGSGNSISANRITSNLGAGVSILAGTGNAIQANTNISGNGALGIDLGGDGVTPNAFPQATAGPNNLQNNPVLIAAVPGATSTVLQGRLNSSANTAYTIDFYSNTTCDSSGFGQGQTLLGSTRVTTDASGNATFNSTLSSVISANNFITATATSAGGNTSEFARCIISSPRNDSWPNALELTAGNLPVATDQYLDKQGQVRWFKFKVQPNSKVIVTLTHLPANYDLTLYKDISQAFNSAKTANDLVRLGAEFAPDSFAPDSFAPDSFAPDSFAALTFAPDSFAPDSFAPDSFAPDSFAAYTFAPDSFAPDSFAPDSFAPDSFAPSTFNPNTYSPDIINPVSFTNAQLRSLVGVSAFDGTTSEGIAVNTWENSTYFYARVRGRNGVFSQQAPFHFEVTLLTGQCSDLNLSLPANTTTVAAGNFKTLILTDMARTGFSATDIAALQSKLATFAARAEVAGVVVDVNSDARVAAANTQADTRSACPSAKNLVASAIKNIVDQAAQANPQLQYVVVIGSDNVIPFFRHADQSLLANERNFVPPVKDSSPSQASLKLGYFLSQDDYGSQVTLSSKTNTFTVPGLAVGRLVESAAEIQNMLNAYLSTTAGVVATPTTALVTGYDFLASAATAVQAQFQAGLGTTGTVNALVTDRSISPADPRSWTASALRTALLGSRHDLVFLAGHFSAGTALAADYTTRLLASEVSASQVNLINSIIIGAGCHAAYNIVNVDGIPQVTPQPDWPQAFADKGATLIAGTGYQYGDTDFIEYSAKLYLIFSQQLRVGSGPVSLGQALVNAKQIYLANTPQIRGIHEKSVLEATLFGLPMLSVNYQAGRVTPVPDPSIVTTTSGYTSNPGLTLGLTSADVSVSPALTLNSISVKDPTTGALNTALYASGKNGTVSRPDEPILPLDIRNVTVPGTVLRGVGFRGATYSDNPNVLPLNGAVTTELRSVHGPFFIDYLYPIRTWNINYFGALTGAGGGQTQLMLEPAQYISTVPGSITGTLRTFNNLNFRLYYSNYLTTSPVSGSNPALSSAPTISTVTSTVTNGTINFQERVFGDPAAGIQQVWVTYTAMSGPFYGKWQSLDLVQSSTDSTLWTGSLTLPAGATQDDFRYIVQAANGVGLVNLATNMGVYYIPGYEGVVATTPTSLAITVPSASGAYGSNATFSAVLTSNGLPLSGKRVVFGVGPLTRQAVTDVNGFASVKMPLLATPDTYPVNVVFPGTPVYMSSSASSTFTITKQNTQLTLAPATATAPYSDPSQVIATLLDANGLPVTQQTVFFIVSNATTTVSLPVITDYAGRAPLGLIVLAPGTYSVNAYFNSTIPLPGGATTLTDYRYNPSAATGTLTVVPKNATLTYTGATVAANNSAITLSATVVQAADGYVGDITLAGVQFVVQNGSTVVATVNAPVSAAGAASTTLAGLPVGLYQVTASLTGAFFTAPPVSTLLAVYSPSPSVAAGFGSITSPAGDYLPNPVLSGTAGFIFLAYYNSGATVPSGSTTIQFQAAGMNFASTSYDWLVIPSGSRAYIQGSGKINNAGNYGFFISVIAPTNGQDLIRLKIWDKTTGSVVYDSQPGAALTADPTSTTNGISIVLK